MKHDRTLPSAAAAADLRSEFKAAMRRLASAIALVTSADEDGWAGMAATAVTSLSTDPPSMVLSVNRGASVHPVILSSGAFRINLLHTAHAPLVGPFSGEMKGRDRFAQGLWTGDPSSPPMLQDSLASILCRLAGHMDYATHTIFVGEVEKIHLPGAADPLLWRDGAFAAASRPPS